MLPTIKQLQRIASIVLTAHRLMLMAMAMLLATACSQQPIKESAPEITAHATAASAAEDTLSPPTRDFDTETLYSLMVAELAGSRNRLSIMRDNYVKQAIDTQDAGITERAAQVAYYLKDATATRQMATQWAALSPENPQAHYMAMASLADAGRYFQAYEHGKTLIEMGHRPHGLDALAVKATQATASAEDSATLLTLYSDLAAQYPKDARIALAQSFLNLHQQQPEQALHYAHKAQRLQPDYEQAYLQELRILETSAPEKVETHLASVVKRFPKSTRIRLQYARLLTRSNLAEATQQFQILLKQSPGDAQIELALALTYYQQNKIDSAKLHFSNLIHDPRQKPAAHYYLGQIAKEHDELEQAITHFKAVTPGKEFLPAIAHAVQLMHQSNHPHEALSFITGHQLTADAEYQEGLTRLLVDHYSTIEENNKAKQALDAGIQRFPRSQALLYNRAMHYAGANQIEQAVADFNTLLAINPDHAEALNSLGYILADKGLRLEEAKDYIEHSMQLNPNNPATIDSLGWVHYRLGNHAKAIEYLQQALELFPNDEIAAHLGEVLWVSGAQKEAIDIWKHGLKLNPNSHYILERLQRFELISEK